MVYYVSLTEVRGAHPPVCGPVNESSESVGIVRSCFSDVTTTMSPLCLLFSLVAW